MAMKNKSRTVWDSSGNEFEVTGFTRDIKGAISGFNLKGAKGQGEKEIALSEYKYYTQMRKRK